VFGFISLLSLLLCVATAVLWVRSRTQEIVTARVICADRHTLIVAGGRIRLYRPPSPARNPKVRREAEALVAGLRNDQVGWAAWFTDDPKPVLNGVEPPGLKFRSAAETIDTAFARSDVFHPLLRALDDPQRLTVAHVLLMRHTPDWKWRPDEGFPVIESDPLLGGNMGKCGGDDENHPHDNASWGRVQLGGLTITLNRWANPYPLQSAIGYTSLGVFRGGVQGEPELDQLPIIRDQWHRRLDVQFASVPLWLVLATSAVLPVFGLCRATHRAVLRRLRKRGRCGCCGYNLTGNTSGTCPECGSDIPTSTATPDTKSPRPA
jgi:hypothetical protein